MKKLTAALAASILLLAGCNGEARYKSCAEAGRQIDKSDPKWNPKLDRDGDGKACETK